ncbi:hypothetical protein L9F63_011435, partial [Diploptera punctata]
AYSSPSSDTRYTAYMSRYIDCMIVNLSDWNMSAYDSCNALLSISLSGKESNPVRRSGRS